MPRTALSYGWPLHPVRPRERSGVREPVGAHSVEVGNKFRTAVQRPALQPRGPQQEIPGQTRERQAKPGTSRVPGQGKCSLGPRRSASVS